MAGDECSDVAVGRACDSCVRRRARWFCAADDAFLCQPCDASVHAANELAARHHRLHIAASKASPPAWHRGFTRKARTPRKHNRSHHLPKLQKDDVDTKNDVDKNDNVVANSFLEFFADEPPLPLVPEMSGDDDYDDDRKQSSLMNDDDDDVVLFQVPVFEPFASSDEPGFDQHQILGFLDSELDLEEFAADVESLLGVEDNDKPFQLDDILGCCKREEEEEKEDFSVGIDDVEPRLVVKVEEDDHHHSELLGFPQNPNNNPCAGNDNNETENRLTLNYEAVIAAWDEQGLPWMTGIRPNFNPENGWPDCLDTCGEWKLGQTGSSRHSNEGRQARVLRYREKRRTRLFSKKIRYEVRKLNAEKRPRMKGRFVKRTSFMAPNNNINPNTMISTNTDTAYPYHFMNK